MQLIESNSNNKFLQTVRTRKTPLLFTALATPFKHGKLHLPSLEALLSRQLCKETDGIVALGTTAESGQLTDEEKAQIMTVVNLYYNRPVVVGVSAQNEFTLLRQAELAARYGASALLVSPPAFCKCTPDGYVKLLLKLHKAVALPVVLYNVPSRAGYSLDPTIVQTLAEKGLNFVKECDVDGKLLEHPNGYKCFSGNDEQLTDHIRLGAVGAISVVSNVYPVLTKQTMRQVDDGICGHSAKLFNQIASLCALQINPIAVKYLLYKTGIFATPEMRLPLTAADKRARRKIDDFLQGNGTN